MLDELKQQVHAPVPAVCCLSAAANAVAVGPRPRPLRWHHCGAADADCNLHRLRALPLAGACLLPPTPPTPYIHVHALFRCKADALPPAQLVLMLQREAALVEEMRAAAADFRKVPVALCPPVHAAVFGVTLIPCQRFDPPLQAAQASRDDFLVNSGPQLPPSLTDSLPVSASPWLRVPAAHPHALQRPPSFLLSVLGLSPDMCAKLK